MLITRITGIACQKAALNELVGLYTTAGDRSKAQVMYSSGCSLTVGHAAL
jgi:hypothetical protein